MPYELWDLETGNYMETLDTEDEAREAIEGYVEANGEEYRQHIGVRPRED